MDKQRKAVKIACSRLSTTFLFIDVLQNISYADTLNQASIDSFIHSFIHILFNYKARDNTNKK